MNFRAARPFVVPVAVLVLAWLVVILYACPGLMTLDSYDHLIEARKGFFTDSHPPLLPALWAIVDRVVPGPFGMLVVQVTMFEAGLYLIFRRIFERRGAALATAVVLVFPPVMVPMAVIWKDCWMAGFLVLAIGLIQDPRRWVRIVSLVLLMLATAARYNAFAATLPLVVLLFEWRPGITALRRYAIATGAWLAITLMAFGLNAALTDRKMHFWHSTLAVFDIVGTLVHVDPMSDAELERELAGTDLLVHDHIHERIRAVYTPRDALPIVLHRRLALWNMPITGTTPAPSAQRDAIGRAWWNIVTSHPLAYLEHRLVVMGVVLAPSKLDQIEAVTRREFKFVQMSRSLGISTEWAPYQLTATTALRWLAAHTPLFVPWLYLVIALVWLLLTRGSRDMFALLLSGLLIEGSLLVLAPSPDYRYSHWLVICTTVAMVGLTARRLRA